MSQSWPRSGLDLDNTYLQRVVKQKLMLRLKNIGENWEFKKADWKEYTEETDIRRLIVKSKWLSLTSNHGG